MDRPDLTRLPDWDVRLNTHVRELMSVPHDDGPNNCLLRAASVIQLMTGVDLARGYRSKVRSKAGYMRVMAENGWETLSDIADAFLPPWNRPEDARRGDLVLLEGPSGDWFGIKSSVTAFGPSKTGLVHVPLRQVISAWRVG